MVYLFHGQDTYASMQAAKAKLADLSGNQGSRVVDADEISVAEFAKYLAGSNLFGKSPQILAKRLFSNTALVEYLQDNFVQAEKANLIIWLDKKADARLSITKMLKKQGAEHEFSLLKPAELKAWIGQMAKEFGFKLDRAATDLLMLLSNSNKWVIKNELEKLRLLEVKSVDDQLLKSIVGLDQRGDIWGFLDALARGNRAKALTQFQLLTETENEQYLIAMLSREIWLMAQIKQAEMRGKGIGTLGINPFVARKSAEKASRYTWEQIQKLSQGLMRLDTAIKQGRVDPTNGLLLYTLSW